MGGSFKSRKEKTTPAQVVGCAGGRLDAHFIYIKIIIKVKSSVLACQHPREAENIKG